MKPTLHAHFVLRFLPGLLTGALCVVSLAAPATQNTPEYKGSPARKARAGKENAKSPSSQPLSQEDVVESVLADTLDQVWTSADRHFHKGEYNHVIALNRIIVQADPENYDAYENAAYLLWSTTRAEEALALLKQGAAMNPKTYRIYDEIGMYYFVILKKPAEALPYYEQAIKFKCPAATWNMYANCCERLNLWEKAVRAWDMASLYANNGIALVHLKRARAKLEQIKNGSP